MRIEGQEATCCVKLLGPRSKLLSPYRRVLIAADVDRLGTPEFGLKATKALL
jgi:hypothetical protein